MKKVVYQGPSDVRILTASDVQSAGVETGVFKKTEFNRGEAVEVDDSVADALIDNSEIFGDFKESADDEPREADAEAEVEVGEATSTGSNQESTGTPSGGGTTGARVAGSTSRSTTGGSSRTR